jgi:hypothetical protein
MLREGADVVAELLEGGALSARTDEVDCCLISLSAPSSRSLCPNPITPTQRGEGIEATVSGKIPPFIRCRSSDRYKPAAITQESPEGLTEAAESTTSTALLTIAMYPSKSVERYKSLLVLAGATLHCRKAQSGDVGAAPCVYRRAFRQLNPVPHSASYNTINTPTWNYTVYQTRRIMLLILGLTALDTSSISARYVHSAVGRVRKYCGTPSSRSHRLVVRCCTSTLTT